MFQVLLTVLLKSKLTRLVVKFSLVSTNLMDLKSNIRLHYLPSSDVRPLSTRANPTHTMLVTRTANNISTTNVSYTRAIIPCKTKKYWFLHAGTEARNKKRNNSTKQ